jgi:hypothetical protein
MPIISQWIASSYDTDDQQRADINRAHNDIVSQRNLSVDLAERIGEHHAEIIELRRFVLTLTELLVNSNVVERAQLNQLLAKPPAPSMVRCDGCGHSVPAQSTTITPEGVMCSNCFQG